MYLFVKTTITNFSKKYIHRYTEGKVILGSVTKKVKANFKLVRFFPNT